MLFRSLVWEELKILGQSFFVEVKKNQDISTTAVTELGSIVTFVLLVCLQNDNLKTKTMIIASLVFSH